MLETIKIKNFAIIDSLELEFKNGLNIITGETGAGKSILLEAIGLILGNRASTDTIQTGAESASVEAVFDISENQNIKQKLKFYEIESDNSSLIIKRVIHKNGKNKILINGSFVTTKELSDICFSLVELCSQHENQSLTKSAYQLELLDKYANTQELKLKVSEKYKEYKSLVQELDEINSSTLSQEAKDFLLFQLNEINQFNPKPNEEEELQEERKKLSHITNILENLTLALKFLESEDSDATVLDLLSKSLNKLARITEYDSNLNTLYETLENAQTIIQEIIFSLNQYKDKIEADPNRLEEVESRLAEWSKMKKKYGVNSEAILLKKEEIQKKLTQFENKQEIINELENKIKKRFEELNALSLELSNLRKKAAKKLTKEIEKELHELSLQNSKFEIHFETNEISENGIDKIQFLFSANLGEDLKPISKVASGGELSRIMLAIRQIVASHKGLSVYLFDEIDSGIGGVTASIVGKKLKNLAKNNQVLCITHLPQVAAFADAHYLVSKSVQGSKTISSIKPLTSQERIDEIARMLGGLSINEKSKEHAKVLLKEAKI
jgi:DNA repair protein RecN (Recombination protein N)